MVANGFECYTLTFWFKKQFCPHTINIHYYIIVTFTAEEWKHETVSSVRPNNKTINNKLGS